MISQNEQILGLRDLMQVPNILWIIDRRFGEYHRRERFHPFDVLSSIAVVLI
jgi:hypothetical protein